MSIGDFILAMNNVQPMAQEAIGESTLVLVKDTLILV